MPIDAQTGTSYTIPITDDAAFLTGNNALATAWTGFALANNYVFSFMNRGAGLITYTPASGTVNGNATQIIPDNWFGFHYTDNTNTVMPVVPSIAAFPSCADSGGNHLNFTTATGAISCGTSNSGGGGALSAITAATTTNTIASGNNGGQIWNWALTANNQNAFTFGETTAATSGTLGNQNILGATTLAGSTAVPMQIADSLTGTQTLPALYVAPTWNTTGVVNGGILENVTNTASGAASLLLNLEVGGTSFFSVDKAGNSFAAASVTVGKATVNTGKITLAGGTSGNAIVTVPAVAGSPT